MTAAEALRPGDRVRHATFGAGTVVETSGSGRMAAATVDFGAEVGVKRLNLGYAPLTADDGTPLPAVEAAHAAKTLFTAVFNPADLSDVETLGLADIGLSKLLDPDGQREAEWFAAQHPAVIAARSRPQPVYESGHTQRQRPTRTELAARYDAIYDIVRDAQPTGIRFAYYTATTRGIVPKTKAGYAKVQRAILHMRRSGRMPWQWITDSNRWMRKPESYGSVDEALAEVAASYRKALWRDTDTVVEVWCESESVAGVLYPVTSIYDVPLYPIKGQTSESFAYGAAQTYRRDRRPLHIIYVGDCDPHGFEIETNLHAKLSEHSGRTDITFTRLACTIEQAEAMRLPGGKAKKDSYVNAITGMHVPWPRPAVEVEALDPPYLRQLVTDAIDAHIDPDSLRLHRMVEKEERAGLLALAGRWSE